MLKRVQIVRFIILLILGFSSFGFGQEKIANPDAKRFQKGIDSFKKWDQKNSFPPQAILFVGSSSIRMWSTHDGFPKFPVINRGFGGAHISDVLYFYDDVIKKYEASLIVFYAGDNDIAAGKTIDQTFEDYQNIIKKIQTDNPRAKFIYIPIKPSISRWQYWEKMNQVNSLVKKYNSKNDKLYYVDLAAPILNSEGKPKEGLFMNDELHLNKSGYSLWQKLLQPMLEELFSK